MNFSDKVYLVRKKLGLTQEELAKELGLSFAAINRWEQGLIPTSKSMKIFDDYCKKNDISFENNNTLGFSIVNESMLTNWIENNKPEAISYFPLLLNDLAVESGCNPSNVRFPHGNQVYHSGFDGVIKNSFDVMFVPDGDSVWEIGCEKDAKKKLNDDYVKRTEECDLEFKKNHTLVLVSSKVKPAKIDNKVWCDSKKDGWKKVVIIDPVDIESWLSHCINTSSKLFAKINNVENFYVESVEKAWERFSKCTSPKMTTSLFTKLREKEIEVFKSKISSNQSILVCSKSIEDAFGFVLSSIIDDDSVDSNCFIITDEKWITILDKNLSNKFFVVQNMNRSFSSVNNNKCISMRMDTNNGDIVLDYRNVSTIKDVLIKDMGISEKDINKNMRTDNVSISTIMYRFKSDSYAKKFDWDENKIIKVLPVLLVDRVDFNSNQDKILLERISKCSSDEIKNALMELDGMNDNPLYEYKGVFKIHNKEIIWMFFKKRLETYFNLVLDIFKDYFISRKLNLTESNVNALFDSLLLYSIYNDKQDLIDETCHEIFKTSSLDKIIDYASNFAELSPLEYLSYINQLINNSEIDKIFLEASERRYFGGYDYTKILFSLERILYINDFKNESFECLVSIFNKKYKYVINNSPDNTIKNNLVIQNNKSPFSFEEKKKFIFQLISNGTYESINLVIDILTERSFWYVDVAPTRRMYEVPELLVTNKEFFGVYLEVVKKLLESNDSPDIIIKLLDNYYCLTKETVIYIYDYIKANDKYKGNLKLYYYLFEQKYHIYKYPKDNNEFIKELCLNTLEIIMPNNLLDKYSVLFVNKKYEGCYDISTIDDNYIEEENKSENLKVSKLKELSKKYSYKTIIRQYAKIIPNDYDILWPFIEVFNSDEELLFMFKEFLNNGKTIPCSNILNQKKNIIIDYVNSMTDKEFENNIRMCYSMDSSLIGVVDFRNVENEKKIFENRWLGRQYSSYEYAMIKKYNPNCYLHIINYDKSFKVWDAKEVINVLLTITNEQLKSIDGYIIKETIDKLENICFNESLLEVEVKYCDFYGYGQLPERLIRYLYLNPQVLIDVLLSKNNDKLSEFKYKLMFSLSMPSDFYKDSINYNNFKNAFLTANNSQNDDFLIDIFGEIYGRTIDIRLNNEASIFARNEIELIHNDKFNTGYYVGLSNTSGVRNVDDGTSKEKEVKMLDELLKQLIKYPECSKIIKMFKMTSRYEAESDRKWYLEKSGLL